MVTANPGDFGRRVNERRQELGLTRADLALKAGVDVGYLDYLEERPGAAPDAATRWRLAIALGTSPERLEGVGFGAPVGSGHSPSGAAVVSQLEHDACFALLSPGGIGRIVFVAERGPIALPVNFRIFENAAVFRTGKGSIRAAVESGERLGFEVDRLDDTLGEGWSVLASGVGHVVDDPGDQQRIGVLDIHPWAGEDRPTLVRFDIQELTGMRIRRRLES